MATSTVLRNLKGNFKHFQDRPKFPSTLDFVGIIDPEAQHHLRDVYTTLCASFCVTVLGVLTHAVFPVHTGFAVFGVIAFTFGLGCTENLPSNLGKRKAILAGVSLSYGLLLGPLIHAVLVEDPGLLFTAIGCTLALFGSFTAAAFLAQRRSYLFLGGTLCTLILMCVLTKLVYYFTGYACMYNVQLYLGLLIFSGYIIFDTQLIIEKAHMYNPDPVLDALELYTDVLNLFLKILEILAKAKEE